MAFAGRVALVTGAASGMGRLAAERLAAQGARVAALDVQEAPLRELAAACPGVRPWPCDVADAGAVAKAVAEAEAELGPIERVMHAAAIAPSGRLLEQEPEAILHLMRVNYGGLVNVAHAVLPGMLARGRGDFVSFGSLAGWLPSLYLGAYTATKSAVNAFSEVLYHENRGRGVRFACVCPPVVDTPMLRQLHGPAAELVARAGRIQPGEVLDAIEEGLEAGRLWIFPGKGTRAAWRLRRFLPGLMWRQIHRSAGPEGPRGSASPAPGGGR